jgi:hypothetical protein
LRVGDGADCFLSGEADAEELTRIRSKRHWIMNGARA